MTKRAHSNVRAPLAPRSPSRALSSLVALGLVVLQLVTALHFALIPHGFSAGSGGFEHVQRGLVRPATERAPDRPSLVTGAPTCAPEACPIGFSGPVSALLAASALASLVALPAFEQPIAPVRDPLPRKRVLLDAPKTSPPHIA